MGFPSSDESVPARAILPSYNDSDGDPTLVYLFEENGGNQVVSFKGSNLAEIVSVSLTDVAVAGNSGSAPGIVSLAASDTQVDVTFSDTGVDSGDHWGVAFTDSEGTVYIAPSPLGIWLPI